MKHLVLLGDLGELEVDTLACEALVDLRVGVESVVNTTTLLLVKDNLEDLGTVLLGAHALTDNLDGEDEVSKDGVVDGGECARTWALLGLRSAGTVGALGAGKDTAGSDDEDVTVGELLLELTGQAGEISVSDEVEEWWCQGYLPLLDLVEALEERDGNEDDNSLASMANLNL